MLTLTGLAGEKRWRMRSAVKLRGEGNDPHPLPPPQPHARRLLARPSYARALDEARPYRDYFPLGAPDED